MIFSRTLTCANLLNLLNKLAYDDTGERSEEDNGTASCDYGSLQGTKQLLTSQRIQSMCWLINVNKDC